LIVKHTWLDDEDRATTISTTHSPRPRCIDCGRRLTTVPLC